LDDAKLHVGAFSIKRGNDPLSDKMLAAVQSVSVVREVNVPTMFSITLSMYGVQDDSSSANLDPFALADVVSIQMGVDRLTNLVTGKVMEIQASYGNRSKVSIHGFDAMHELRFGRTTRIFAGKSTEEIFTYVAGKSNLTTAMLDPPPPPDDPDAFVVQSGETNYEFLLRLCAEINFEMLIDPETGELTFRPSLEDKASGVPLQFPRDIESLNVTETVETEGGSTTVRTYDSEANEMVEVDASYSDERDPMGDQSGYLPTNEGVPSSSLVLVRPDLRGRQQMSLVARGQTARGTSGFVRATATLVGDPQGGAGASQQVVAGEHVEISGLGSRFDGLYYVTKSIHSFDGSDGYRCEVELNRSSI
jgi:phage protein D